MLHGIKSCLRGASPRLFRRLQAAHRRRRDSRINEIQDKLIWRHGLKVVGGPFAGMAYIQQARKVFLPAKQLGAYEMELHPFVARIIKRKYARIIDIGAAEGYYAIGLALRSPGSCVYAFDIDSNGREWCSLMARANHVEDRVIVGGACNHETLQALLVESTLVFSDCEGFELELLDPICVPALSRCDVLVELHDEYSTHLTLTLLNRFRETHEIFLIHQVPRKLKDYPLVAELPRPLRSLAVSDIRGERNQWAFMTTKAISGVSEQ